MTTRTRPFPKRWPIFVALLLGLAAAALSAETAEDRYGYFSTVEGEARLVQTASGTEADLEANYPLLSGDTLRVLPRSRVEAVLPDANLLRAGADTELVFERLAYSADSEANATALRLYRGELQLEVQDLLAVAERPRVDTDNATVYLQAAGRYYLYAAPRSWTELVVREGFAEVVTQRGSVVVRAGERGVVEGDAWPQVGLQAAGGLRDLELWGDRLAGDAYAYAGSEYVEPELRYAARPLARHGSWVHDSGRYAWRPAVAVDWRPYSAGWWTPTPLGLTWVSHEPWGWLTYHYGTWHQSAHYGWIWYPGPRFAPAWVYWYWGPSYVAWTPVGYYTHYYAPYYRGFGFSFDFRFGTYGWAGGHWRHFSDWTFCPTGYLGRRHIDRHYRSGRRLAIETRRPQLERGLITTDTRGVTGDLLRNPGEVPRALSTRAASLRAGRELPDVTPFVARQRELPREVADAVLPDERRAVSSRASRSDDPGHVLRTTDPASRNLAQRLGTRGGVVATPPGRTALPGSSSTAAGAAGTTTWRAPSGQVRSATPSRGVIAPAPGAGSPHGLETRPGTAVPSRPTGGDYDRRRGVLGSYRGPSAAPRGGLSGSTRPGVGAAPERPADGRRGVVTTPPPSAWNRSELPPVRRVVEGIRGYVRGTIGSAPPSRSGRYGTPPGRGPSELQREVSPQSGRQIAPARPSPSPPPRVAPPSGGSSRSSSARPSGSSSSSRSSSSGARARPRPREN